MDVVMDEVQEEKHYIMIIKKLKLMKIKKGSDNEKEHKLLYVWTVVNQAIMTAKVICLKKNVINAVSNVVSCSKGLNDKKFNVTK